MCNLRPDEGNFRLAPSVGRIRFDPTPHALDEINNFAGSTIAFNDDHFVIKQRFFGHGRRDRRWGCNEGDPAAGAYGQLTDDLGHEAIIFADHLNGSHFNDTYVHANRIGDEIEHGRCEVPNPSEPANPDALRRAIARTSLQEADFSEDFPGAWLALDGRSFAIGDRNVALTAGLDIGTVESHSFLRFRSNEGIAHDKTKVLGSKGISSAGERPTDMMLNSHRSGRARLALPTGKLPANLQTGKNP